MWGWIKYLGYYLHYFKPWVRKVFVDYGVVVLVIFTGFIHFGGKLDDTDLQDYQ